MIMLDKNDGSDSVDAESFVSVDSPLRVFFSQPRWGHSFLRQRSGLTGSMTSSAQRCSRSSPFFLHAHGASGLL